MLFYDIWYRYVKHTARQENLSEQNHNLTMNSIYLYRKSSLACSDGDQKGGEWAYQRKVDLKFYHITY